MDGVGRIMNKQKVTEVDTGGIEQWRVLIITGIIIIIIMNIHFLSELLRYKVCSV
jgi:hypothetical protein